MRRSLAGRITFNTIALVLALIFIFPVYWMVSTALTPAKDLFSKTPSFIPLHPTLALWLTTFQTQFGNDWGATMAAATLFALPVLVLFMIMQRRAVGGLTAGAVKG